MNEAELTLRIFDLLERGRQVHEKRHLIENFTSNNLSEAERGGVRRILERLDSATGDNDKLVIEALGLLGTPPESGEP